MLRVKRYISQVLDLLCSALQFLQKTLEGAQPLYFYQSLKTWRETNRLDLRPTSHDVIRLGLEPRRRRAVDFPLFHEGVLDHL